MTDGNSVDCPFQAITLPHQRGHLFNPPHALTELHKYSSIHRLLYPDGHLGWLVTSHATIRKILLDPRFSALSKFKRAPIQRASIDPFYGRPALPGWMVDMDPPQHTRFRKAISEWFSLKRLKELKPRIENIINEHLDAMAHLGCPLDLIEHFALPIPSLVICELLGVPYEQRQEFQMHSAALFSLEISAEQAVTSMDCLTHLLRDLIRKKRAYPTVDLLSELVTLAEFSDEEIAGLGVLLLTAGHETTASMLGLGTLALLTNPSQLTLLKDDLSLIENAVEELLRYITIFQFGVPRTPLEDVEIEGCLIKTGESVTLSLPAGNHDPKAFETADQLDIKRSARGHLAFGFGIHYCMGRNLARIEMQLGYSELFRRFPTLRLAVPSNEVEVNTESGFYGIHRLLVAW